MTVKFESDPHHGRPTAVYLCETTWCRYFSQSLPLPPDAEEFKWLDAGPCSGCGRPLSWEKVGERGVFYCGTPGCEFFVPRARASAPVPSQDEEQADRYVRAVHDAIAAMRKHHFEEAAKLLRASSGGSSGFFYEAADFLEDQVKEQS